MPSDYGHEQTDKELKRLERQITKEYSQAAKEVEKKLTDYLEKFAKKDAEMQKKVASGQMSAEEYCKWRIGQMAMGERWKEMQKTLTEDLVNADKIAAGMINDSLPSAYALNYNYGTYEVEHGARINTSFTLYDHSTVENLLKKDPKIIPQARVDIPKDELWNRRKLTSAITQGILQGESIPKIAKRLASVADMDRKAAIRNARTYTTAAENKGRIDSYDRAEQMGIKVNKKWMATLDDRTRVEHRHLDGQVRENDEPFETDGYEIMFPGDPSAEPEMIYNCRCTLVAEIEGYQYQDERNDSKLGDMTYEEWKHAKDKPGTEVPEQEEQPKAAEQTQEEKPITEPAQPDDEIKVVQGKDLSQTWERRKEEFEFEIDDIINAQGFDGLPKVVSKEKFEKAVKESSFVAQRTYSAVDQKTLDTYHDALVSGKWYVDCSTGGSAHGKGMYSAANYDGEITEDIKQEMRDYIYQNMHYTSVDAVNTIETFTVDPSAKFIELPKDADAYDYMSGVFSDHIITIVGEQTGNENKASKIVELNEEKRVAYDKFLHNKISSDEIWAVNEKVNEEINRIVNSDKEFGKKIMEARTKAAMVNDAGSMAALMGYDGIRTHYGTCGADTIILNRTKLIFLEG